MVVSCKIKHKTFCKMLWKWFSCYTCVTKESNWADLASETLKNVFRVHKCDRQTDYATVASVAIAGVTGDFSFLVLLHEMPFVFVFVVVLVLIHENNLRRLSSFRSVQNIGWRFVSSWDDLWQQSSCRSSPCPSSPDLLSACLAMSSLVFQSSSCHLLVSILRQLISLAEVAGCVNETSSSRSYCVTHAAPFAQIVSLLHRW